MQDFECQTERGVGRGGSIVGKDGKIINKRGKGKDTVESLSRELADLEDDYNQMQ